MLPATCLRLLALLTALAVLLLAPAPIYAQEPDGPAINAYTEQPYAQLPLREIRSHTVIAGPVAKTQIAYVIANKNTVRTEVGINFHLPADTVLTAFGYYYKGRFIRGKMYDTNEAWKIYTAVTSRGRDPGIMDRPSAQDYHVQVYPVEANRDLRVIVELSQALAVDKRGAHFELPLTQTGDAPPAVQVRSDVVIQGHKTGEIATNDDRHMSQSPRGDGTQVRLTGRWRPTRNWVVTLRRQTPGPARSIYSALNPSRRNGYYALTVSTPYRMVNPRVSLSDRPGTNDTLPTQFGSVPAYGRLFLTGRYYGPGPLNVTVHSRGRSPLIFTVPLSGQVVPEHDNPASGIWADKRIAALQSDHTDNHRAQIVRLSKRFTVVSQYTALLAIPAEELAYYHQVLAHQKIGTNTRAVGGGGGDPYIAVKAPDDALQVVAVFPNGDVKNLTFDTAKNLWDGRFDIPFGTPAGEYRVTVIVVHQNGLRSRFTLVYQYLTGVPQADHLSTLRAHPGGPFRLSVTGKSIARAVAVLPWGQRVNLTESGASGWAASLRVPADWPKGTSLITLVLLDGAHDQTEVSLDLDVR